MESLVLKLSFINDNGEKGIISLKDVKETLTSTDISDLMGKIIQAGYLIKHSRATKKGTARLIRTITEDFDI